MSKLSHSGLHDRIAAVERRLERRRSRLLDDARESASAAGRTATKVVPVAAALGAGLLALYLTRRHASLARPSRFSAFRARYADPPRRAVRWAQLAGILGSVVRIGASPQLRALIQGYRAARARERRR